MVQLLTVTIQDFGDGSWFSDELFDETHIKMELEEMGVATNAAYRDRHYRIPLYQPLTEEQVLKLNHLKNQSGLFREFFISDMIAPAETLQELVQRAAGGERSAARGLYQFLQAHDEEVLLQHIFEPPLLDRETDARVAFFLPLDYAQQISILPLLQLGKLQQCRNQLIAWATTLIEQTLVHGDIARGSLSCLYYLLSKDEMVSYIESRLEREETDIPTLMSPFSHHVEILTSVWKSLRECLLYELFGDSFSDEANRDEHIQDYKRYAVDLYLWFLEHPRHDFARSIVSTWNWLKAISITQMKAEYSGHTEEAVYGEAAGFYTAIRLACGTKPNSEALLNMLNRLEQGVVTPSDENCSALFLVARLIQFRWTEFVEIEETDDEVPERADSGGSESKEDVQPTFVIDDLGTYTPQYESSDRLYPERGRIRLFLKKIAQAAHSIGVEEEHIKRIVLLHEAAHAVVHLGSDSDGRYFSTDRFQRVDGGTTPSLLHETLAQILCYHALKHDELLLKVFLQLQEVQSDVYKQWTTLKDISVEHIRMCLIQLRNGNIEPTYTAFSAALLTLPHGTSEHVNTLSTKE